MADTATKTAVPAEIASIISPEQAEAQLPAVVTEEFRKPGDLINRADFTDGQNAVVAQAVEAFDVRSSAASLRFGAETQRRASEYMDELLADMRVGQAGVAGEILTELTTGVSLMNLRKVRDQIASPPGWFARIMNMIGMYTDYIHAFIDSHKTVVGKFTKIEDSARNLIATLSGESDRLDSLVESTTTQVNELRVLIAVGEDVLAKALEDYAAERDDVLAESPVDSLKLQKVLDFKKSIRAFEVRLLRIKTAYVEAATTAIRQIRLTQEAIKIEIQNVSEAILFDLPSIKRAILHLAALKDLQDAQAARKTYDGARSEVQDVLVETTLDVHRMSVDSQGDALARAQHLDSLVSKMIEGARLTQKSETEAAEKRRDAAMLLEETKRRMDEASSEEALAAA